MAVDFTRKDPPWVDVPDPENPPASASKIMASDLNRIEDAVESLAAESGAIEVDTSVGTRVFVGGQMIYGDTDWRILPASDFQSPWTGEIRLRRILDTVEVRFLTLSATSSAGNLITYLPSAFRPSSQVRFYLTDAAIQPAAAYVGSGNGAVGCSAAREFLNAPGSVIYSTDKPWPSTLPGTPA